MSSWTETLNLALAGAARHHFDVQVVLSDAGRMSLQRLAGWIPRSGISANWPPCPSESRQSAPSVTLNELLDEDGDELLLEWMQLAAGRGLVIPPTHTAALLDRAAGSPALQETLLEVLGERGRWLAALNPDWDFAASADPADAFARGGRRQRVRALRELRAANPTKAGQMLASTWSQEGGDDRAALLGALEVNLRAEDEEFLVTALADGRKEVRLAARDLLARLPGSAFAERMKGRAHEWLRFRTGLMGARIDIDPPKDASPELLADAIETKPPHGMGKRAWILAQVLNLVPPSEWPVEILGPALGSDWAQPVWQGLIGAATRFRDPNWARTLVERSLKGTVPPHPSPVEAVKALDSGPTEDVVDGLIGSDPRVLSQLIEVADHLWSKELSMAVARRARDLAAEQYTALRRIAYSADPSVLPELERSLDGQFDDESRSRGAIERCLDTLRRRDRIAKELTLA